MLSDIGGSSGRSSDTLNTLESLSQKIDQGLGASGQLGGDCGPVIDKVVDLGTKNLVILLTLSFIPD